MLLDKFYGIQGPSWQEIDEIREIITKGEKQNDYVFQDYGIEKSRKRPTCSISLKYQTAADPEWDQVSLVSAGGGGIHIFFQF